MEERMKTAGMKEGAKRQRRSSEGRAQRTSSRPTSRDAYISNECRAPRALLSVVLYTGWTYSSLSRTQLSQRGRYVGSTDIRCRLDYDILTIRRLSSVEKAELQRHL